MYLLDRLATINTYFKIFMWGGVATLCRPVKVSTFSMLFQSSLLFFIHLSHSSIKVHSIHMERLEHMHLGEREMALIFFYRLVESYIMNGILNIVLILQFFHVLHNINIRKFLEVVWLIGNGLTHSVKSCVQQLFMVRQQYPGLDTWFSGQNQT